MCKFARVVLLEFREGIYCTIPLAFVGTWTDVSDKHLSVTVRATRAKGVFIKVLLSRYIVDDVILLLFCLAGFRLLHHKDWHGWEVQQDYLLFASEDVIDRLIDK